MVYEIGGDLRRHRQRGNSVRTVIRLSLAASLIGLASPAFAQGDLRAEIAADYKSKLAPLFDYFHRNPELSHREFKTAERLAKEIRALGYDVTEKVGGTPAKDVGAAPSHHSPFFKVEPEPAITVATEAMVVSAMRLFNGQ